MIDFVSHRDIDDGLAAGSIRVNCESIRMWARKLENVHRLMNKTAVIMFDTRTPEIGADNYWSLAAQLNYLYARHFDYDFIYYLDDYVDVGQNILSASEEGGNSSAKIAATCYLNGTVARGAPWGKIPAVADALSRGYETVMYVDSDAFFRSDAAGISIEEMLKRYGVADADEEILLWMASNAPWNEKMPNSGLQLWINRPRTMKMLRRWWNIDVTAQKHPFEQRAVTRMFKSNNWPIAVMEEFQWMVLEQWPDQPALHIPSAHKEQRETQMQHYLGEQSVAELPVYRIDTTKVAQQRLELKRSADTILVNGD